MRGPVRDGFVWTLLALIPASFWWEPRPHAFSLLFIPLTVLLLVRERYAWLPLVFLVWANCHGGVVLGLVILGACLGAQTLQAPRTWRRGALIFAACVIAVTATPHGVSFWTEIPKSLARIRLYPLDEWRPPRLTDVRLAPFWLILTVFCASIAMRRRTVVRAPASDATVYAGALVLLPMALMAIRNVGPFLMLAVPALTYLVQLPRAAARNEPERPAVNFAIVSTAAVAVMGVLAWAYANEIPKLKWKPVPAAALDALAQCPDNLYNRYDEGGGLIWFAPERKVFMDGRQDPFEPELVLEHIRMETAGADYRPVFSRHRIRCAYLPVHSPTVAQLADAGWKTLYRDPAWIVLRD